ncbi:hypothetical protein ABT234_24765 [Streptomyces sp. NPDC001586]|uniref:hypothetical protein n=1 Tax=Streptomyces sp. NPDC001586 TaxID=3154387 RepID=UPI003322F9D7
MIQVAEDGPDPLRITERERPGASGAGNGRPAAMLVGDQEEPVVAGDAYVAELGGGGDDRALGFVLRGLDAQDGVLGGCRGPG